MIQFSYKKNEQRMKLLMKNLKIIASSLWTVVMDK